MPNIPPGALTTVGACVAVLAAGIAWLALGLGADEEPRSGTTVGRVEPSERPAAAVAPGTAPAVTALVRELPLERKVAQLFLLGFAGRDGTAPIFASLRNRGVGGVVVDERNYAGRDQLASLADAARAATDEGGHVRPFVLAPQEGGEFNAFADLPPATAAADLESDAAALAESRQAARALGELGIDGVLAPVADVAPPGGLAVGARAYSDRPTHVARYVRAVVRAYRERGMLTAAAHFPGLGLATEDTRLGVAQVGADLDELREHDLAPFRAANRAGVPALVVSNALYVTDDFVVPGSLSYAVTTELLRGELRFGGIAITDDLADPGVTALSSIPDAAVRAVAAGADLLYISGPASAQQAAYGAVIGAVRDGDIAPARVDEALARTLAVKQGYGMLE